MRGTAERLNMRYAARRHTAAANAVDIVPSAAVETDMPVVANKVCKAPLTELLNGAPPTSKICSFNRDRSDEKKCSITRHPVCTPVNAAMTIEKAAVAITVR